MSSALRSLPVPTQYYVAVCPEGENVYHYVYDEDDGWTATSIQPVTSAGRTIYKDLGVTILYNPRTTNPLLSPPVDLRKVAPVSTVGLLTEEVMYIPLGTRLKGTSTQQRELDESCWVSLMAAGVSERQFGLRS